MFHHVPEVENPNRSSKEKVTSFFQQIWAWARKGSQHLILYFLPGPLPVTFETKKKTQNNNCLFFSEENKRFHVPQKARPTLEIPASTR
jgi:hypothetical protein